MVDRRAISPSFSDVFKRRLLGKPLTSEQLKSERLSTPVALGAIHQMRSPRPPTVPNRS
jgi:hypothetical protein